MLPVVYYKAVPMLDNCIAAPTAPAAASVTPVLLDQSTYRDAVQSNHTAFDQVHCILFSIGSSNH